TAATPPTATSPGTPGDPGTCNEDIAPLLSTLTVYNEGLNPNTPEQGGHWLVTAPSATGTPYVINCGPNWTQNKPAVGPVCTATYPLFTTVTLTAPPEPGVAFGGWSSSCDSTAVLPDGSNTCTINSLAVDATVGAIFNNTFPPSN